MPTARRSLARLRENNLRNDVLSRLTGCKFATQGLTFHPSCIHVAEKPKRNAKSEPSEHRPQRGRGYSEGNLSLKLLGNVLEHCTIKCIAARWLLQVHTLATMHFVVQISGRGIARIARAWPEPEFSQFLAPKYAIHFGRNVTLNLCKRGSMAAFTISNASASVCVNREGRRITLHSIHFLRRSLHRAGQID